ncbi:minor capsid protein [Bacillus weihaiensis]|uniref:minor capsid protein n=1 Tax=Bacillus weihaiensis TaxID=1547283 RepID=UPI002356793F|nr:minor capsid protein [Bacillus weihaiensis]
MDNLHDDLLALYESMEKLSEKEFHQVLVQYKNSQDKVKQLLADFFMRYATDNVFDFTQLQYSGALKRLDDSIQEELNTIATLEVAVVTTILGTVFTQSYYRTAFQLEQSLEVAIDFNRLNQNIVNEFVDYDWSGMHYSERIWNNQQALKNSLKSILVRGIQEGESLDKMARKFNKQFGSKAYQSQRLVRTETARIISQSKEKLFAENNMEKVEWSATLEGNTCKECASLDGKVFKLSDPRRPKQPRHPLCRCDWLPVLDNYQSKTRKDNETKEYVPYQSFEEWEKAKSIN